ncbi:MAG: fhuD [Oscillospiraceae bacterium]|nr:fhuD [Oscillospiraceae bacterium]
MKKSLALIALSLSIAASLTACTGNATKESNSSQLPTSRVVSTLKGDVEVPASPTKIVDISGSSEELILLGITPVGTANIDSYQTDKVPSYIQDKLGSAKVVGHSMMETMDMEKILACDPDLILMSQRQEKIYDQLKEIAPTIMIKDYANDWRGKFKDVSKLFDKENVATEWLSDYDKKAQEFGKIVLEKNGDKSYLPVLSVSGSFMVFSDSALGSIINDDMKLKRPDKMPKQDGITLPTVTMEGLTKIDSDYVIVIATEADKKDLEKSSVWKNIRAVKNGNATILSAIPYFTQVYNPIGKELLLESIKNELIK